MPPSTSKATCLPSLSAAQRRPEPAEPSRAGPSQDLAARPTRPREAGSAVPPSLVHENSSRVGGNRREQSALVAAVLPLRRQQDQKKPRSPKRTVRAAREPASSATPSPLSRCNDSSDAEQRERPVLSDRVTSTLLNFLKGLTSPVRARHHRASTFTQRLHVRITTAEKVRRLHAAGVTDTAELMRRANTSRQAVHAALQRTGKRGRPPRNLSQMTIAVPVDTGLWIQEQANQADCSLGDVVHSAIAAVRSRRTRVSKPNGSGE